MSTKKKLWISVITLCVAILSAVGITVGVIAANSQGVFNSFNVVYSATNVSATVSASYTTKGGTTKSSEAVSITADEATTTKTLTIDQASLSSTDNYVIYKYSFKNDNTAGGRKMTVGMADSSTVEGQNVTIKYLASAEDGKGATDITATSATGLTLDVDAQGTGYFYVMVTITDLTKDVNFTSDITFTLNSVTDAA